jgi:3-oxoacyl-[acyl-carrier protein] reductase
MLAAELFDIAGRTALVTGASSGLGDRFARVLAKNGARVVCLARRRERLDQLVDEIAADGGTAYALVADVTNPDAMARSFAAAEEQFGPIEIIVNNAGIAETGKALDQPSASWRRVLATNLDAVQLVAQLAAQRLVAAGHPGTIINIASILGFGVARGLSAYAVAKAGVVQLTRALALELAADQIRVNAIAPGYVVTDMNRDFLESPKGAALKTAIPMRRFGEAGDLDGVLLLLASPAGRFITGATYVVDGGHLLTMGH